MIVQSDNALFSGLDDHYLSFSFHPTRWVGLHVSFSRGLDAMAKKKELTGLVFKDVVSLGGTKVGRTY